jgi:hypothetical protein
MPGLLHAEVQGHVLPFCAVEPVSADDGAQRVGDIPEMDPLVNLAAPVDQRREVTLPARFGGQRRQPLVGGLAVGDDLRGH